MNQFLDQLDREHPACLFCQSTCCINSRTMANQADLFTTETYSCAECKETFYVYSQDAFGALFDHSKKMPICYDVRFSCNELSFWYSDDPDHFLLGNNKKSVHWMKIPPFMVDFSDKDRLYRKLKIYLLFS